MRTVILEPAAELARQRFSKSLLGFRMAYSTVIADLSVHAEDGWLTPGGRHEYMMAVRKKPRILVVYEYRQDTLVISHLDAYPAREDS